MSPAEALQRVGPPLYGEGWRKPLANALGVTPRTLYRWIEGHTTPRDLYGRLWALVQQRERQLRLVAFELGAHQP